MALDTHTSWSLACSFLAGHHPWSYDSCDSPAILLLFYFVAMELAASLCSSSSTLTLLPMVWTTLSMLLFGGRRTSDHRCSNLVVNLPVCAHPVTPNSSPTSCSCLWRRAPCSSMPLVELMFTVNPIIPGFLLVLACFMSDQMSNRDPQHRSSLALVQLTGSLLFISVSGLQQYYRSILGACRCSAASPLC